MAQNSTNELRSPVDTEIIKCM